LEVYHEWHLSKKLGGGDINLNLRGQESWGDEDILNTLVDFFQKLFEDKKNCGCGTQGPHASLEEQKSMHCYNWKILERFLVSSSILFKFIRYRSWIGAEGYSYHFV